MPSRWTMQGSHQDEEIEDLQQEINQLKQRLSRLERRKGLSSFAQDFDGFQSPDNYASMMDSRSFVQTKSLPTDDDDEGIVDDQISSTPPSIDFNFKEFEDPLSKSSSLPIFDEPIYDVYADDMFFEVLEVDTPVNNDAKSMPDVQPELFAHNVPKVIEKVEVAPPKAMEVKIKIKHTSLGHTDLYFGEANDWTPLFHHIFGHEAVGIIESIGEGIQSAYAPFKELKIGRQCYTGWKYPYPFSQPNPPPYGGQPDIFLRA